MRPSPARSMAPEPDLWIPIESLETLPELEELLDPRYLVDSGQSRAVKMGDDGQGYVFIDPDMQAATKFEDEAKRHLSHKRWVSKRRTLALQRQNKLVKVTLIMTLLIVVLAIIAMKATSSTSTPPQESGTFTRVFIPTKVPVVLEGKPQTIFTVADTTDELLEHNQWTGLVALTEKYHRASFASGKEVVPVEIRYPKIILLNLDSTASAVLTTELDVASVLAQNGVVIDGDDVVTPSRETLVQDVHSISIKRVSTTTRTETQNVAFKIEKQNDATLPKGKTTVKRAGVNGSAQVTYTQTLENGSVVTEVESSRVVTKNPVNQLVLVGTKNPQYESGKATFYSAPGGTCAHKTLPMGTVVTVTNTSNGKSVTCRVADRGPFGAGRIIDLSNGGFSQIASLSQGVVSVTLSW